MTAARDSEAVSGHVKHAARSQLLREIERTAPEVVDSLKSLSPQDWAKKWFGGAPWAIRQAERTREMWLESPACFRRGEFGVYGGVMYRGLSVPLPSAFHYKAWNPNKETEQRFRTRILDEFKTRIEQEILDQKERGPEPHVPALKNLDRDCEWLVRYHFKRERYAQIVRDASARLVALDDAKKPPVTDDFSGTRRPEKVSADAVSLAVRNLATIIELQLRTPDPPGRAPRQEP